MTTSPTEVRPILPAPHQGRWGVHATDYATYAALKKLNAWAFRERQAWGRWARWTRKQPQNRVVRQAVRNARGQKCGRIVVGPAPEPFKPPISLDDCARIEATYRLARTPFASREALFQEVLLRAGQLLTPARLRELAVAVT